MALDYVRQWDSCRKIEGYVYLIQLVCGTTYGDVYKVGFAVNALRRFRSIQESLPFYINVVSCYLCADALRQEAFIHLMFGSKRLRGEWYRLCSADILFFNAFFGGMGCRNGYWIDGYRAWYCMSDNPERENNDLVDFSVCRVIRNTVNGNVYQRGIQ